MSKPLFESWAEGQLAGFDKQARVGPAGVRESARRMRALLAFLLDSYHEQGPATALAWCEWHSEQAEMRSERWLAQACAEWLR